MKEVAASVEALREQISRVPADALSFELRVPTSLTFQGAPVRIDVAMAIILDAVLARGFWPAGRTDDSDGATYRYERESTS